ncbi:MAG: hypothetical protein AAF960_19940 [Bacteroidota bacterium]
MSIKFNHILFLFILVIISTNAQSQTIQLTGSHSGGQLILKWYPTTAGIWDSLQAGGYQLERYQLNETGTVISTTKSILNTNLITAKDSLWFSENGAQYDGYVEVLGMLLYDPAFDYGDTDILSDIEVKFNYLVKEAQYADHIAAKALGMFFEDTTMVDGLSYRYVINGIVNGQTIATALFDMDNESGIWESSYVDWQFNFPGGQSLTEMSGRLTQNPVDQIRLISKAYGDSIVLRWGPNHLDFWERANKAGYRIMRLEERDDGIGFSPIGIKTPWPEEWVMGDLENIEKDSMALVAGQMLYGEMDDYPQDIYEQTSLAENRFIFSLYAAERSPLAAEILGLRYVDKNVESGKTYIYFVDSPASTFSQSGDFEEVTNTKAENPIPQYIQTKSGEHEITLSWNKAANEVHFSSYYIERSDDDGQTFQRLTPRPLSFLSDPRYPITECIYRDSVAENYKTYIYRIIGLDAFAEESEPAEVKGQAHDLTPPPKPYVLSGELLDDTLTMELKWGVFDEMPDDFAGFRILLNEGMEGAFDTISQLLPITDSIFRYTVMPEDDRAYFFKVATEDIHGNLGLSSVKYIHFPDLIPPAEPTNLEGSINKDGIVSLAWDHSPSDDVEGYWVFYGHHPEDQFFRKNGQLLTENFFQDTIPLKSLSEKIYYSVSAQDDNYNRSEPSFMIELDRPDNVPPVTPIMNAPVKTDTAVILSWTPSGSEDVVQYNLLRKAFSAENTRWEEVAILPADSITMVYVDKSCEFFQKYSYIVEAVDDANNYSEKSNPVTGELRYDYSQLQVSEFEVNLLPDNSGVRIAWAYLPPSILPEGAETYKVYLYKSYGGATVKEFVQLNEKQVSYFDEDLQAGALYNYAVRVIYNNGISTDMSEVLSVIFEGEE